MMAEQNASERDWFSLEETAALLHVTVQTVRIYVKAGYVAKSGELLPLREFPARVNGRARMVYPQADVEAIRAARLGGDAGNEGAS